MGIFNGASLALLILAFAGLVALAQRAGLIAIPSWTCVVCHQRFTDYSALTLHEAHCEPVTTDRRTS